LLQSPSLLSSVDTAALDAALLLGEVLRKTRAELIVCENDPVSKADRDLFLGLVARRRNGECVAYILGRREFRGLEFAVNAHVLVPRPDTETLVEAVLEYTFREYSSQSRSETQREGGGLDSPYSVQGLCEKKLLDLCTGSGAVAIALKNECSFLSVTASDISPDALETARLNAERLLGDRAAVRFIQSDLFEHIHGSFDIIVSNPPYIPSGELSALPPEVRGEPQIALDGGGDGLELIRNIAAQAGKRLLPGGALFLEADPGQMQAIGTLLESHGFGSVRVYKDLAGRERVFSAKYLNARSVMPQNKI